MIASATFYIGGARHGTSTAYIKMRCRCEDCRRWNREHTRVYRAANKERINAQQRARYAADPERHLAQLRRRREIVSRYKVFVGCVRCGFREHPFALQFHHRDPASKLFGIGPSISRGWNNLKAEIRKYDVLCANCHAIIEATSGGDAE